MLELFQKSQLLIDKSSNFFRRGIYDTIVWETKLLGVKGARGTGKTSLLMYRISQLKAAANEVFYVSLDDIYFTKNGLVETAEKFIQQGGKYLFIDEVHKYPLWARHIKNLYDFYDVKIVFTGSSIIDINKEEGDLSRRAVIYQMPGLSFREFLLYEHNLELPIFSIETLFSVNSNSLKKQLPPAFKPFAYFKDYLRFGYFPFYKESTELFSLKLQQVIRLIVESDMAELKDYDTRNARKMLQLLAIIADNVPFKPNIQTLANKTEMSRNTIYNYLQFLEQARLIHLLYPVGNSIATLQKPDKVYLENTAIAYVLSQNEPNVGNLRETFFFNQVSFLYDLQLPKSGDFLVDNKWTIEIGGKNKSSQQIKDIPDSFRVLDDIEFSPYEHTVPLWMFGLLY